SAAEEIGQPAVQRQAPRFSRTGAPDVAVTSLMVAVRLEGQVLDRLLDRFRLVLCPLARVQEQDILGAHDGLEALLAALAIFPRLGVEAANHTHAAPLVEEAPALLSQPLPRLN